MLHPIFSSDLGNKDDTFSIGCQKASKLTRSHTKTEWLAACYRLRSDVVVEPFTDKFSIFPKFSLHNYLPEGFFLYFRKVNADYVLL